ncbi:Ig-like domain-containing protein [Kitasatospora sp. GP82]|uniref:L,D-transpeptidase n=1 Tax=Kitasatospora sp. GP82 TaxID=3035089 RepID=UPI002476A480|nr:Ig-like domain-containing protein [Kitasatospora sp. GP82]
MKSVSRALVAGLLGGALALTTACSSSGKGGSSDGGKPAESKAAVSAAQISIEPKAGATDVKPQGALKVAVAGGKLSKVTVTDQAGKEVAGAISADGAGWVPAAGLAVSSQYKVSAQAADDKGVVATADSSFTTLTPAKTANPHDNVDDNGTYGVGMIISLSFGKDVKDKAAVEKGITFDISDGTVLKGHWFGSRRVDYRPEHFWKSGTKITVHYKLKSVEVAPDVYGGVDSDETFTIGRDKESTVDASTHQMTVEKDGKVVQTIPISTGASEPKSWNAYNGTMVIEAREGSAIMDSSTVPGLEGSPYKHPVPHSLRLTDSGTYVHGNNWSDASVFGHENVSHGCIGLQDAPGDQGGESTSAGKFYADSIIGDVVTVKNSVGEDVKPDNGLSGWNLDWKSW